MSTKERGIVQDLQKFRGDMPGLAKIQVMILNDDKYEELWNELSNPSIPLLFCGAYVFPRSKTKDLSCACSELKTVER